MKMFYLLEQVAKLHEDSDDEAEHDEQDDQVKPLNDSCTNGTHAVDDNVLKIVLAIRVVVRHFLPLLTLFAHDPPSGGS